MSAAQPTTCLKVSVFHGPTASCRLSSLALKNTRDAKGSNSTPVSMVNTDGTKSISRREALRKRAKPSDSVNPNVLNAYEMMNAYAAKVQDETDNAKLETQQEDASKTVKEEGDTSKLTMLVNLRSGLSGQLHCTLVLNA
jgi:hypothetical protein